MLETSKDLLNIMLGSSILMIALLTSWLLYQVSRTIKGVNDVIKIIQNIADNVDEGINTFKDKAGSAAAFLPILIKGAQSILASVKKKKSSKKTTSKKQK